MLKKIQNKLKFTLTKDRDILFGYVFGSALGEKFNYKSDIDVALYLDEKKVKNLFDKRLLLIDNLEGVLKREVEVVILNEIKSIFFKFVIIKEGKLFFERNHQKRVEFELKTMQDYYDFKPFLEEYNKAYIKRELAKAAFK